MKKRGFSLIELLVVISIIGILLSILVLSYNEARKRSRDKVRKTDLKELQLAIELYKSQNGRYPTEGCSIIPPQWAGSESSYTGHSSVTPCVGDYVQGLVPDYIAALPSEPSSNKTAKGYAYRTTIDGSSYKLIAHHNVESQLISGYGDDFARYSSSNSPCPSTYPASEKDIYSVYSRGAECW